MPAGRAERLNGEFKRALGEILLTDIKDPRVSDMTAIMRVLVTPDLKFAKIYTSVYASPESREETIAALNGAEAFIRSRLNAKIKLRRIPSLLFVLDDSIEYSVRMSKLIDDVTRDLPPAEPEEEDDL